MIRGMQIDEGMLEGPLGRIWYKRHRSGGCGLPLLCVHGGPGFMSVEEGIAELVATGRDVIFYDQYGCGRSEWPSTPSACTNEYYVEELALVRRALGLEQVHLLAQSWGCMLAVQHVLSGASGVGRMILSGPLLSSPKWAADQRRLLAAFPADLRALVERCESQGDFGPEYQEAMMTYYRRHICRLDPWPYYLVNALSRMNTGIYCNLWGHSEFTVDGELKNVDLVGRLEEVHCPVLLTCGEFDEACPETVHDFAGRFTDARVVVFPGASHSHIIEEPKRFQSVARQFLAE
jgi:proline iminopeptidase